MLPPRSVRMTLFKSFRRVPSLKRIAGAEVKKIMLKVAVCISTIREGSEGIDARGTNWWPSGLNVVPLRRTKVFSRERIILKLALSHGTSESRSSSKFPLPNRQRLTSLISGSL